MGRVSDDCLLNVGAHAAAQCDRACYGNGTTAPYFFLGTSFMGGVYGVGACRFEIWPSSFPRVFIFKQLLLWLYKKFPYRVISRMDLAKIRSHHSVALTHIPLLPLFAKFPNDPPGFDVQRVSTLKQPIQEIIQNMETKPSCIISTLGLYWVQEVTDKFKISVLCLLCTDHIHKQENIEETLVSNSDIFSIPGLTQEIVIGKAQVLDETTLNQSDNMQRIIRQHKLSYDSAP
ncbi:hypothetical protein RND71_038893 [Anisodus tanguticus]|uniref:Uncharacterized protein n=1 Tax=Anisodus tanguticus TaxID=243964 RepID=A0AAE1R347_9SOLA|nr:hypothetical protein RND71_038893 [Anisodus tanguticus]